MLSKFVAATVLLPLAWAFSDTAPLVAWSSHENTLVNALSEQRHPQIDTLLRGDDICNFDAVVVIDQPGLHAHDLKTLSPTSAVPLRLKNAHRSVQLPYVRRHTPDAVSEAAEALATRCGSRLQWTTADGGFEHDAAQKHVLHISLPEVYGEGTWRRYRMAELEETSSRTLQEIESAFSNHLFIYTSSIAPGFDKRQTVTEGLDLPFSFAPGNGTSAGGIFANYQLLTPGLILSLLVAFFVLVPIVMLAVTALASIQSSVRLDAPKGPSQSKKNQ